MKKIAPQLGGEKNPPLLHFAIPSLEILYL